MSAVGLRVEFAARMSRRIRIFQVDAFTTERFTGNPAGVVLDADGRIREAGIALSAAGPTAVRVGGAEAALQGQRPSADLIRAAADAASQRSEPQADLRGSIEFKKHLAGVLVARGLRQALARLGVQV